MRKIAICIPLLALAACEPTAEQQARMQRDLPRGCTISDLGSYGDVSHVVAVFCDGRRTNTTSYEEKRGKSYQETAVIEIEP